MAVSRAGTIDGQAGLVLNPNSPRIETTLTTNGGAPGGVVEAMVMSSLDGERRVVCSATDKARMLLREGPLGSDKVNQASDWDGDPCLERVVAPLAGGALGVVMDSSRREPIMEDAAAPLATCAQDKVLEPSDSGCPTTYPILEEPLSPACDPRLTDGSTNATLPLPPILPLSARRPGQDSGGWDPVADLLAPPSRLEASSLIGESDPAPALVGPTPLDRMDVTMSSSLAPRTALPLHATGTTMQGDLAGALILAPPLQLPEAGLSSKESTALGN